MTTREQTPLPGAKVELLNRPEFGYTFSRANGEWVFYIAYQIFLVRIGHNIRGRRLKFSMANWKNRRPSFDLLRKVIQGQPSFRQLFAPRKVRPKREISARVLGTWRNRHPGSVPIPVEFLRFHSSSSALPTMDHRAKFNFASGPPWNQKIAKKNLVLVYHPKVVIWLATILSICRPLVFFRTQQMEMMNLFPYISL